MARRVITIDWLTMYCECSMIVQNRRWEWRKSDHGTNQFRDVWRVYDRETRDLYCIVEKTPYSPIIPKNATMIQVSNRYLYYENWNVELNNFMTASNIRPISISRIDIACDFNRFAYNLHPQTFIQGVAGGKYRLGRKRKVAFQGELEDGVTYEYMRLGNRESEISGYLYNKTKELQDVMEKPYIRKMWKDSGLNMEQDVWRLEVSLSNKQMRAMLQETGEIFRIDLDFISTQGVLENVYNACVNKVFDFRHNEVNKRTDRLKRVKLFDECSSTILMVVPSNEPKTNKMDKIIIKRLANYHSMYRIEDEQEIEILHNAMKILLKNEELVKYYYQKVEPLLGWYKER